MLHKAGYKAATYPSESEYRRLLQKGCVHIKMLMPVKNENAAGGESVVLERSATGGVNASLFEKINLNPVSEPSAMDIGLEFDRINVAITLCPLCLGKRRLMQSVKSLH